MRLFWLNWQVWTGGLEQANGPFRFRHTEPDAWIGLHQAREVHCHIVPVVEDNEGPYFVGSRPEPGLNFEAANSA